MPTKTINDYTNTINFIKNPFTDDIFEELNYSNIKFKQCKHLSHTKDISFFYRPYYNFNCSKILCGDCCEIYCGWCCFKNHNMYSDIYLKKYNVNEIEKIFNLYEDVEL